MGDMTLLVNFLLRIYRVCVCVYTYNYRKVEIISIPTGKSTILLKEKVREFVYVN